MTILVTLYIIMYVYIPVVAIDNVDPLVFGRESLIGLSGLSGLLRLSYTICRPKAIV